MNYESYKQFFDGGFFPIDSDHKLVNLENTGEFEVTATTDSGAQTKVEKHYLPSKVGLTNMLRNYTGGGKFEALTQSQGHTFIPELADCTSYTGAQKAIVNHFEQTKKPLIIDLDYSDAAGKSLALTFETDTNRVIEWGDGETYRGVDKAVNHQYAKAGNFRVKIYNWIDGQIKVQKTGGVVFISPIFISFYTSGITEINFKKLKINKYFGDVYVNIDSTFDFSNTVICEFSDANYNLNYNSGLAEWINLEEMASKISTINVYAKNLYFDWKDLTFGSKNYFTIEVYPDEITAKTCIEYFANKATFSQSPKVDVKIKNLPGAQSIYQWAVDNYAEKFNSISITN